MSTTVEPGQVLGGRWRIDRFLASGGFGRVFAATDISSAAIGSVAVKVLLDGASTAERQSLLAEARHMSALAHTNLVPHIDSGLLTDGDGAVFLVTDLCDESLAEFRERQPGQLVAASDLRAVVSDISAGLTFLHGSGRVHRDLKPANILRSGDRWKLADFGLVRDLSLSGVYHLQSLVGSPRYMAPEFFADATVGPAADIWAVGVIVHELAAGQAVFAGEGPAYVQAVTSTTPTLAPGLAPGVAELVRRCLDPDPDRRPTAAELPALLDDTPAPTGPVVAPADLPPTPSGAASPGSANGAGVPPAGDDTTVAVPPPLAPAASGVPTIGTPSPAATVGGGLDQPTGPAPLHTAGAPAGGTPAPEIPAGPTAPVAGRRRWWMAAVAALVLLVGGIGAVLLIGNDGDDDPDADGTEIAGGDQGESGDEDERGDEVDPDDTGGPTGPDGDSDGDSDGDKAGDSGTESGGAAEEPGDDPAAEDADGFDGTGSVGRTGVALDEFSVGDCATVTDVQRFVIDTLVPCDQPHEFEVISTHELPQAGGPYPGPDGLLNAAITLCTDAFSDRFGVDQADTSLSVLGMSPTAEDWDAQIYEMSCVIYRSDFSPLVAPVADIEDWRWKAGDAMSAIELQPGMCFDAPVTLADGFAQRIVFADCSAPHDGEHMLNVTLTRQSGEIDMAAFRAEADESCHDLLHERHGDEHSAAGFTSQAVLADAVQYETLDTPLAICLAVFEEPTAGTLDDLAGTGDS